MVNRELKMVSGTMAKKRAKKAVEPEPFDDEDDDVIIEGDEVENDDGDDDGLTYTKRYTVSRFVPEKSYGGSRLYKDFYETDVLAEAKKEAEKVLNEEKLESTIWDRENWCISPIRYVPEAKEEDETENKIEKEKVKVKEDNATTKNKPDRVRDVGRKGTGSKRGSSKPDSESSLPKPKHPRKKRS